MDPQFVDLRAAIYSDKEEFYHFRSLLVNAVMATDIMDKDAAAFRKERWAKAFSEGAKEQEGDATTENLPADAICPTSEPLDAVNRKATIVIEQYVMDATDCSVLLIYGCNLILPCLFLDCQSLIQASDVAHTMQHWAIYTVREFKLRSHIACDPKYSHRSVPRDSELERTLVR
jgi:hypothetical protein